MRGFCGIGVYHPKTETNIGTLIRSARAFDIDFVFTIGRRYKKQASAIKNHDHIPVFNYIDYETFINSSPKNAQIICVDTYETDRTCLLQDFKHPERAIYLLGAEDHGLPMKVIGEKKIIKIDTRYCLNVASAGTVILYDRSIGRGQWT